MFAGEAFEGAFFVFLPVKFLVALGFFLVDVVFDVVADPESALFGLAHDAGGVVDGGAVGVVLFDGDRSDVDAGADFELRGAGVGV